MILPQFLQFCEGCDHGGPQCQLRYELYYGELQKTGISAGVYLCGYRGHLPEYLLKNQSKHTLDAVAKTLGISLENHHRAVDDAECTAHIFVKFIKMLEEQDIYNLTEVNALGASSVDAVKKMPSYHAIILAKNDLGRINLYRLVSQSHLTYFNKTSPDSQEPDAEIQGGTDPGKCLRGGRTVPGPAGRTVGCADRQAGKIL